MNYSTIAIDGGGGGYVYLIAREDGPSQGFAEEDVPSDHTHNATQPLDQGIGSSYPIGDHQEAASNPQLIVRKG